jgi:hypothetical protein
MNEAPRSSLLRRSSHFGYEGRKLRGILRNSPKPLSVLPSASGRLPIAAPVPNRQASFLTTTTETLGPLLDIYRNIEWLQSNGYSRGIALDHRMNTKYCEWIPVVALDESIERQV